MPEDADAIWQAMNEATGQECFIWQTDPPEIRKVSKPGCIGASFPYSDTFNEAKTLLVFALKTEWDIAKMAEADAMERCNIALKLEET